MTTLWKIGAGLLLAPIIVTAGTLSTKSNDAGALIISAELLGNLLAACGIAAMFVGSRPAASPWALRIITTAGILLLARLGVGVVTYIDSNNIGSGFLYLVGGLLMALVALISFVYRPKVASSIV